MQPDSNFSHGSAPRPHQRDDFGECLTEIGKSLSNVVVLDADNSTATRTAEFARTFPSRFINVGVAEQNLIGTAAGLALAGMRPVACTFSIFLVGRAFETIRNLVALDSLPVTLVGTHAGISVGKDGATHFAIEDIALMRSTPNMQVVVPADRAQIRQLLPQVLGQPSPTYFRVSRWSMPPVTEKGQKIALGKGLLLQEGDDCAILATGLMVYPALVAAQQLKSRRIRAAVGCLHTLKPLDVDFIIGLAKKVPAFVTAEEHSVLGGLHSAVSETLTQFSPRRCMPVGIKDTFAESGDETELFEAYGLSSEAITRAALRALDQPV